MSLGLIGPKESFENSIYDFFLEVSLKFEQFRTSDGQVEFRKTVYHTTPIPIAGELAFRHPFNDYFDVGILFYVYGLEITNSAVDRKYSEGNLEYGIPITLLYPIGDNTKLGLTARLTSELSFDDKRIINQQAEILFKFERWL